MGNFAGYVAVIIGLLAAAPASATAVWARWEHTFTSTASYPNPYRDVTLRVTFTHTSGTAVSGYGFWDGGETFKIRFLFPKTGKWTWKTSCSDIKNTDLNNQSGTVDVTAYKETNPLYRNGYPVISANKRYLTYSNGEPFLWIGDTAWGAFIAASQPSWERYIQDRAAKRFTVTQLHAGRAWLRRAEDTDGNPPFLGEGAALRWNPAYWQGAERKVQYANEARLLVCLTALRDVGPGFPIQDPAEVRLFARNLAARLMGNFVVFSPVADDLPTDLADAAAAGVRDATSVHLITAHPRFLWEPAIAFHAKPYTDFAGTQSGAGWTYEPYRKEKRKPFSPALSAQYAFEFNLGLYNARPIKPVLNLEGPYDSLRLQSEDALHYGQPYPKRLPRSAAYVSFLSGAKGYTYGCGGIWNWGLPHAESTAGWPFDVALNQPSSTHMRYLAEFLSRIEWWRLEPAHALIRNQPEEWTRRMALAISASGDLAVAYLPENSRIVIDLRAFPQGLQAVWFEPSTNRYLPAVGTQANRAESAWEKPSSWEDAVLLLTKSKEAIK
ncbi:MAG: DUF4038 domain-containing protein [Acidobacteria bacterium]|nr:DUF4038 domain-containing protein [Acidobacteriota bacterium]